MKLKNEFGVKIIHVQFPFWYLCNYIFWELSYFCYWLIIQFSEACISHLFVWALLRISIHLAVRYCISLPPSLNPESYFKVSDGHSKARMLSVRFSPDYFHVFCFLAQMPSYTCIYTYIYIYICIYIHTCKHTYIHIYLKVT